MESQEQDLHLIEDAVESEIASVASYSKGELYSPWIEDTDLTPYLTKFAILQRARESAKFEAALGEWTKRAFDNLASIKLLEVRIAELEQKYNELVMAVSLKFPNETRHETALKFIRAMDMPPNESSAKAITNTGDKTT